MCGWKKNRAIIEEKRKAKEAEERAQREREEAERKKREEEERIKWEAEREEREAREREEAVQRAQEAIISDFNSFHHDIVAEEKRAWEMLMSAEFQARMGRILELQISDFCSGEEQERLRILAEWRETLVEYVDMSDDLNKQAHAERSKVELWAQLEKNRKLRAEQERRRQERVARKERSYVERAILPVRDSDGRRAMMTTYDSKKDELMASHIRYQEEKNRRAATLLLSSSPVQTSPAPHSPVTASGNGNVSPKDFGPNHSYNPAITTTFSPPRYVDPKVPTKLNLRPGTRVFVPHHRCRGSVVDIAPDGRGETCRVRMDFGAVEWFDRSEIEIDIPTGVAAPSTPLMDSIAFSPPRGYAASASSPTRSRGATPKLTVAGELLNGSSPRRQWNSWQATKQREESRSLRSNP
eukprot:PhM_4_TR3456/c2_g1_i4/m.73586